MKLILLRHEKRQDYPGFYSTLTKQGFIDSIKLIKKFKDLNINEIYCSPLVRTVQTIYPYCKINKKKINVEYALYEYKLHPYFLMEQKNYNIEDLNNKYLYRIINKKYNSKFKNTDFNYFLLETDSHLEKRLKIFLNSLLKNLNLKDKTILIVSHKGVINKIKNLLNIYVDPDNEFKKGHFEIINI